jgi:FAD/FMN-containing dehydrogenase
MGRPCTDLVLKHFTQTSEPFNKVYPWMVITELSDVLEVPLETALRKALDSFKDGVEDFLITADKGLASSWWNLRKHISDAQKIEGVSIKHDISVPVSNVPAFIEQADAALGQGFPGVRIVAFGHIGDGNIHYNASMPDLLQNKEFFNQSKAINRVVYDIVAQLDGSISAEHGLGQLKRDEIRNYKNALELELMQNIKRTLDPQGLMNPGKVI